MILGIDSNAFWAVALMPILGVAVLMLGMFVAVKLISGD